MSGEHEWHARVDPRLRRLVDGGAPRDARVRVFVRTTAADDRLEQLGVSVGQRAGDVVTAELSVGDVPVLASDPDVHYVELSRALGLDDLDDVQP